MHEPFSCGPYGRQIVGQLVSNLQMNSRVLRKSHRGPRFPVTLCAGKLFFGSISASILIGTAAAIPYRWCWVEVFGIDSEPDVSSRVVDPRDAIRRRRDRMDFD